MTTDLFAWALVGCPAMAALVLGLSLWWGIGCKESLFSRVVGVAFTGTLLSAVALVVSL